MKRASLSRQRSSPPPRSLLLSNRKALGGWGRGPTRTRPLVPGTVTGDVPSHSKLPVCPPRSRDAGQERPLVFLSENLTYPNSSAPPLQRRHEQHGTARRNKSRLLARLAGTAGSIYACAGIQARKRGRGSEAQRVRVSRDIRRMRTALFAEAALFSGKF